MNELRLRIMGGLGNQLFQYAAARYLQEIHKIDRLVIEKNEYKTYKIRDLEITNFVLSPATITTEKTRISSYIVKEIYHVYQKLYLMKNKAFAPMKEYVLGKTKYLCSTVEFRKPNINNEQNVFMYGYFVSADVAKKMRSILMNETALACRVGEQYKAYRQAIESTLGVGVSIRCGEDYANAGWPICSKEFYLSGMGKILKEQHDCFFYVFSDDIERIKQEQWFDGFSNVCYVDNVSVCESFDLLRRCRHYVCANSSFSWWGSFLSYSESPIVYEPNFFYAPRYKDSERLKYEGVHYLDYITGDDCNGQ